ncbi:MAG: CDP-alcohol phosphatidyltransferase family protein [Acidimicrobiia bacterium]
MIEVRARKQAERLVAPIGRFLARMHVSPAGVTLAGLVITIGGAVLVAVGQLAVGSWIVVIGSIVDSLDGAVARATGKVTDRGAFVDSVADRMGETAMWAAVVVAVPTQPVAVLCVLVLGGSLLTSYLRAKAESVGIDGTGGVFGRAERIILYTVGLTFSGILVPVLWILVVGTWVTVAYRFSINWRQLRE